jgi:hypothetical protein
MDVSTKHKGVYKLLGASTRGLESFQAPLVVREQSSKSKRSTNQAKVSSSAQEHERGTFEAQSHYESLPPSMLGKDLEGSRLESMQE